MDKEADLFISGICIIVLGIVAGITILEQTATLDKLSGDQSIVSLIAIILIIIIALRLVLYDFLRFCSKVLDIIKKIQPTANRINIKKSDYELNRANFSATMGLGMIALCYTMIDKKDLIIESNKYIFGSYSNWIFSISILVVMYFGVLSFLHTFIHYFWHFKNRDKDMLKDLF